MIDGPARLLLVEDEQPNRALLRAVLTRARDERLRRATVLEAGTLAVAREALGGNDPIDLVLLDVRLPDGSGIDLAREITGTTEARPKVLILSASVMPQQQAEAVAAGCDAFLAKPYRPPELLSVLGELLGYEEPAS